MNKAGNVYSLEHTTSQNVFLHITGDDASRVIK